MVLGAYLCQLCEAGAIAIGGLLGFACSKWGFSQFAENGNFGSEAAWVLRMHAVWRVAPMLAYVGRAYVR